MCLALLELSGLALRGLRPLVSMTAFLPLTCGCEKKILAQRFALLMLEASGLTLLRFAPLHRLVLRAAITTLLWTPYQLLSRVKARGDKMVVDTCNCDLRAIG